MDRRWPSSAILVTLMPDILVSVVVASWNTRDLLATCLTSLVDACCGLVGPVEITVVDNASSDGSAAMLRERFPAVQLVTNRVNAGFAAATNQGIRLSRGRYVLLLNPDTTATRGFLQMLVSFLDVHPAVGAVGPRLVDKRGTDQVSCYPLPTVSREIWRLFHMDRIHPRARYPLGRWGAENPRSVESVQGACMLIRRSALDRVGLLDERFFVYTEEIDLSRRVLESGWQIFWVPNAVIVHYGGASTEQVSGSMFLQLYRSKVAYFRKHQGVRGAVAYKLVLAAASVPRVVVPALGMWLLPTRRTKLRSLVRNYSQLLAELPAL